MPSPAQVCNREPKQIGLLEIDKMDNERENKPTMMIKTVENFVSRLFWRRKERELQLQDVVDFWGPYHNITDGPRSEKPAIAFIERITVRSDGEKLYGLLPASDWFDKQRGESGEMWITLQEAKNGALDITIGEKKIVFIPTHVPRSYFKPWNEN